MNRSIVTGLRGQVEIVTDTIEAGTLLIADGSTLPGALHCESVPFATGWAQVRNLNSKGMNHIIERAGWRFFFIADVIEMVAFGADEKQTAARALKRIIASLKARKFNCLEVKQVAVKRFLGIPYVKVSAHSRHIQKGLILFGDQERTPFAAPDAIAA